MNKVVNVHTYTRIKIVHLIKIALISLIVILLNWSTGNEFCRSVQKARTNFIKITVTNVHLKEYTKGFYHLILPIKFSILQNVFLFLDVFKDNGRIGITD